MKIINEDVQYECTDQYDPIVYEANEGRKARIDKYRTLVNLDEDVEITEGNIEDWAFNQTCVDMHCDPARLRAELLGQKWSDYEN